MLRVLHGPGGRAWGQAWKLSRRARIREGGVRAGGPVGGEVPGGGWARQVHGQAGSEWAGRGGGDAGQGGRGGAGSGVGRRKTALACSRAERRMPLSSWPRPAAPHSSSKPKPRSSRGPRSPRHSSILCHGLGWGLGGVLAQALGGRHSVTPPHAHGSATATARPRARPRPQDTHARADLLSRRNLPRISSAAAGAMASSARCPEEEGVDR